ncbi:DUF4349 domain-containing protein [Candidatus Woesearchaeota archaeon]|nr:DUF4349 domain-containing protein [Candidatus Woesearchaeota archaeon]
MGLKDQFRKLGDNWLIIVLALVLVLAVTGIGGGVSPLLSASSKMMYAADYAEESMGYAGAANSRGMIWPIQDGFAPEENSRKMTRTASLGAEVERGTFQEADAKLKEIASDSGSFILNENVNNNGAGLSSYYSGSYVLKVDVSKYDDVMARLKALGKVKSFHESTDDITGSYVSLETSLRTEKDRLARYNTMLSQATKIEDKITLSDRIFDEERQIAALEDAIKNAGQRVAYSTVTVSLTEERSGYAGIAVAKLSSLVKTLVASFNSLLYLIFAVLPYAVAIGLIALIVKGVKKLGRKKK